MQHPIFTISMFELTKGKGSIDYDDRVLSRPCLTVFVLASPVLNMSIDG